MNSKTTILKALEQYRGDNLYRAKAAFRNFTPDEMKQQYGHSGSTCAEIVAGYEAREAEVNAAIADVQRVFS